MRAIALFLLTANVIYFSWARWIDAPNQQSTPTQSEQLDITKIVLASERPHAQHAPVNKAASNSTLPSATATQIAGSSNQPDADSGCVSVGPFQDLPSAAQATATLASEGFESKQRFEQGELWVGYWLTVADIKSRESADKAIGTLKQHGIADAYVISGSDPPNLVSLGVFKEQERAQRLMQEVKTLGLNAQMTNRTRTGSVYWLDVTLGQAGKRFDMSLLGAEPGKILRLELSACR